MVHLLPLLLQNPISTIRFAYSFVVQSLLLVLRRLLLPHFPTYQSFRLQLQRAYLSSCSVNFPDLTHRLPVGSCPESVARRVGSGWTGYVIPGTKDLQNLSKDFSDSLSCVAIYAHGGGYARGEARMYLKYMNRWTKIAAQAGLDLTFLSVEYPLTGEASHPAQRDAFLTAYQYVLTQGVSAKKIIFMGDSAGGGLCVISSIELMSKNLPQPAGSVLISPWMDMSLRSHQGGNALVETDYIVTANVVVPQYVSQWLGGLSGTSPEVNPLYRKPEEIEGLNPQLILVGAAEFALQESKDLAALCQRANVCHALRVEWGQLHIYAMGSDWIEPAVRKKSDATIVDWMKQCLG